MPVRFVVSLVTVMFVPLYDVCDFDDGVDVAGSNVYLQYANCEDVWVQNKDHQGSAHSYTLSVQYHFITSFPKAGSGQKVLEQY
jgi:hypothetical protein